jgi:hypothetical protein
LDDIGHDNGNHSAVNIELQGETAEQDLLQNANERIWWGETVIQNRSALFRGRHFEELIIILCAAFRLRQSAQGARHLAQR